MTAKKRMLRITEIEKLQEELCALGILEKYTDYKISEKYLREFLDHYSRLYGKYSYITGSVLLPLFARLKKQYPEASEEEITNKSAVLAPIIRVMLEHERVFALINKVSGVKKGKKVA